MQEKHEVSAGGVVYRRNDQGLIEVLICKHSGYHKWVLPKGLVEEGESLEETAVREVNEEVGVVGKIQEKLGEPESYTYTLGGQLIHKQVHYYLMEYVTGEYANHDFEMEDVEWVSIDQAVERMGYEGAKRVLVEAQKALKGREG